MESLRKNPLIYRAVVLWGSRKTFPTVAFAEGEVVTPLAMLDVPVWGTYMRVPPEICAVVNAPSGEPLLFYPGDYPSQLDHGLHPIRYVDLRRHTLLMPEVQAASIDAWDVRLTLSVQWRVSHPELVLDINKPLEVLITAFEAALVDFIQANPHDGLVVAPGSVPISGEAIAMAMRQHVRRNASCRGFEILEATVLKRTGDRRRTEAVQHAIVEKTIIAQERMVQRERKELTKEALDQEKELAQQREALAIKEAEIARLKVEEEEQVRLRKAEISALEAEKLRKVKMQEIEMQNMARQQEQAHEKVIKSMELRAEMAGKVAEAIIKEERLQGLQTQTGSGRSEMLASIMSDVVTGMPAPDADLPALPEGSIETLQGRLAKELIQLIKVRGAVIHALKPCGADHYLVTIDYLRMRVLIDCGSQYPQQGPGHIAAQVSQQNKTTTVPIAMAWAPGNTLQDVLFEAVDQVMNPSSRRGDFVPGNGHYKETHLPADDNKNTGNETGENKQAKPFAI